MKDGCRWPEWSRPEDKPGYGEPINWTLHLERVDGAPKPLTQGPRRSRTTLPGVGGRIMPSEKRWAVFSDEAEECYRNRGTITLEQWRARQIEENAKQVEALAALNVPPERQYQSWAPGWKKSVGSTEWNPE